ncbi:hypothetical protein SRHO_G00105360 [Serrasalmus rhombeus]
MPPPEAAGGPNESTALVLASRRVCRRNGASTFQSTEAQLPRHRANCTVTRARRTENMGTRELAKVFRRLDWKEED